MMFMKSNIKIVLAQEYEMDAIHDILIERCKWFIDNKINQWKINWYPNKYNNEYFLKQMKENFLYVAKIKNEVVGVMLLKKSDKEYWNNDNDSYFLHHFATRLGNKGIGSVMLEFAYQKCLEDGKEYLRLDSWGSNYGLTKYYENMNFVNVKTGEKGVYKYRLWEKKVKK